MQTVQLKEVFTYINILRSLMKSSTADRFPNTMFMIMKKNAPTLTNNIEITHSEITI